MFGVLFAVKPFLPISVGALLILIVAGAIIYFVTLLILRDEFVFEAVLKFISIIKARLRRNDNKDKGNQ